MLYSLSFEMSDPKIGVFHYYKVSGLEVWKSALTNVWYNDLLKFEYISLKSVLCLCQIIWDKLFQETVNTSLYMTFNIEGFGDLVAAIQKLSINIYNTKNKKI